MDGQCPEWFCDQKNPYVLFILYFAFRKPHKGSNVVINYNLKFQSLLTRVIFWIDFHIHCCPSSRILVVLFVSYSLGCSRSILFQNFFAIKTALPIRHFIYIRHSFILVFRLPQFHFKNFVAFDMFSHWLCCCCNYCSSVYFPHFIRQNNWLFTSFILFV